MTTRFIAMETLRWLWIGLAIVLVLWCGQQGAYFVYQGF
jgi:hypothetical protein